MVLEMVAASARHGGGVDIVWSAWRHAAAGADGARCGVCSCAHTRTQRVGVPSVSDGRTYWNTPDELAQFAEGSGPGLILWDELPQAITQMQNAIAGALLDWQLGPLRIDRRVFQIATGNRTQDKAGANRVVSQLGNRVMHLELEAHLDDWCQWALSHGIDPMIVAFLRLRPNLLHDFLPDRLSNPTPRSWEMVSRSIDHSAAGDTLMLAVAGLVGEGAAAEYVGFRQLADKMPDPDLIMKSPATAPVPDEPGVLFAVCAALAHRTTESNFDTVMTYLKRLPVEFSTMAVKDAITMHPKVASSKAFADWAVTNGNLFV